MIWSIPNCFGLPCCAGKTTCFKTRSPSLISLGLTMDLYLLVALCLVENSQTGSTSLNSSTESIAYSNLALFIYWLNWDFRHKGMPISTANMEYALNTMANGVYLVVEWGIVWYDHNILWISYSHKPLASSRFFTSLQNYLVCWFHLPIGL